MGRNTPSYRRRQGRLAFIPTLNPMDLQPYRVGSWGYEYYLKDWLEGWEAERRDYEASEKELAGEVCGENE